MLIASIVVAISYISLLAQTIPIVPVDVYIPVVMVQPVEPVAQATPEPTADRVISFGIAIHEEHEYAEIENTGNMDVNLSSWILYAGDVDQDHCFPDIQISPNQSIRIYTDGVPSDSMGYDFDGDERYVWNNDGDCGCLYDADADLVEEECYGDLADTMCEDIYQPYLENPDLCSE